MRRSSQTHRSDRDFSDGGRSGAYAWNLVKVRNHLANELGNSIVLPSRKWKHVGLENFDWSVRVSLERVELV